MRILITPAPYKECMDSRSVAETIALGLGSVLPRVEMHKLPLCDGGTGIVDRLIESRGGGRVGCQVHDPLMTVVDSHYGILAEMALAA